LCGDRDLARARDARRTPAGELSGAKTSHDDELESVELNWTLYHATLTKALVRAGPGMA
jgi:hypothetical protein